jgi:hypothetical protein
MPFPLDDFTRTTIQHHFRRKKLEWTEAYFVNVLETSEKKYDVYFATIALRDCGTERCIPALKAKLNYSMQDVKCTSILTIAHIAGARETSLYAESLLDPTYKEKGYAMWAICDAADERAVDAVLTYFKKNLAKLRNGTLHNGTVGRGFEYLHKHADDPEVAQFFSKIKGIWIDLDQRTKLEINNRLPEFG